MSEQELRKVTVQAFEKLQQASKAAAKCGAHYSSPGPITMAENNADDAIAELAISTKDFADAVRRTMKEFGKTACDLNISSEALVTAVTELMTNCTQVSGEECRDDSGTDAGSDSGSVASSSDGDPDAATIRGEWLNGSFIPYDPSDLHHEVRKHLPGHLVVRALAMGELRTKQAQLKAEKDELQIKLNNIHALKDYAKREKELKPVWEKYKDVRGQIQSNHEKLLQHQKEDDVEVAEACYITYGTRKRSAEPDADMDGGRGGNGRRDGATGSNKKAKTSDDTVNSDAGHDDGGGGSGREDGFIVCKKKAKTSDDTVGSDTGHDGI